MRLLCSLMMTALLCGACHGYKAHPGSLNTFDSVTADTLTGVKATLDATRPKLQSGALPNSLKPAFADLAQAYDAAIASYRAWREAAAVNPASPAVQLQADLSAVTKALAAFTQAGGK